MEFVAAPARLSTTDATFEHDFAQSLHWSADTDAAIEQRVADILADVQQRGDAAVLEYTARFDGLSAESMAALELTQAELKAAFDSLPTAEREALESAARRVRSYHEAQKKANGESWSYRDEGNEWLPDLDDIRAKITPHTRAIVIINPNNPTGVLYPDDLLRGIVAIAREHNLVLLVDEVYDKVLYDDVKHTAMASLSNDVLTLTFNSLSKAYRSCGYRAGWMIVSGPKHVAKDYIEGLNMLANLKLGSNVPGQWAIQTALGGYQSIHDLVKPGGRLRRQRDLAYELITAIPGVTCVKPQAALYMFPRLDPAMYPIADDRDFFMQVLRATRVMLVQGSGFNYPDHQHFRIVFLPHEDDLRVAIGRLADFLAKYRQQHGTA